MALAVRDQHRNAIGSLNRDQQARLIGDQSVGLCAALPARRQPPTPARPGSNGTGAAVTSGVEAVAGRRPQPATGDCRHCFPLSSAVKPRFSSPAASSAQYARLLPASRVLNPRQSQANPQPGTGSQRTPLAAMRGLGAGRANSSGAARSSRSARIEPLDFPRRLRARPASANSVSIPCRSVVLRPGAGFELDEDGISSPILPAAAHRRFSPAKDRFRRQPWARTNQKPEKRKWAYLPVGPFERQLREGIQGGFWEEVHEWTLKKE